MSDELNEQQDASNLDEGQAQEQELDVEALKAQAAKADEYKKYADRVAAENKELKKAKDPLTTNQSSEPYATKEEVEKIALIAKGYSEEEASTLMRYGGLKALDDSIIMQGIESARKAKKSQDATPSGSNKSTVFQKYTEQDLKKMSAEDLEKIVPQ